MVPTHRLPAGMPSNASMRPRISAAALLVKVTASTPQGETFSICTSQAMRCTSTRVLPLPAPASTSTGASAGAVTASRWASFSGSRMGVISMADHCTSRIAGGGWPATVPRGTPGKASAAAVGGGRAEFPGQSHGRAVAVIGARKHVGETVAGDVFRWQPDRQGRLARRQFDAVDLPLRMDFAEQVRGPLAGRIDALVARLETGQRG